MAETMGRAMAITLICPRLQCRTVLTVPDDVRGQYVRCGECGASFSVPEKAKAEAPAAQGPKPAGKQPKK